MNAPTTLMMTHVLSLLQSSHPCKRHIAFITYAGSQGYHALKEMLQNGKLGTTLLIERGDLRTMPKGDTDWYFAIFDEEDDENAQEENFYDDEVLDYTHACVFTNRPEYPIHVIRSFYHIESIEFCFLPPYETVDAFMAYAGKLKSIDLSPLSNVRVLGELFLYCDRALTTIDLSPLSQVTSIGGSFLRECQSLESIDLSPLSNVKVLEDMFLFGCHALTEIDLSPLSQVTVIGESFLRECKALTTFDMSHLANVTELGSDCFTRCARPVIDISMLTKLKAAPSRHAFPTKLLLPSHLITKE